jgi:hypothetical protein
MLPHTEVFGAPPDELVWTDEARRHAADRLFTGSLCSQQMHLDTAGKVEASLDRCSNPHALLNQHHLGLRIR